MQTKKDYIQLEQNAPSTDVLAQQNQGIIPQLLNFGAPIIVKLQIEQIMSFIYSDPKNKRYVLLFVKNLLKKIQERSFDVQAYQSLTLILLQFISQIKDKPQVLDAIEEAEMKVQSQQALSEAKMFIENLLGNQATYWIAEQLNQIYIQIRQFNIGTQFYQFCQKFLQLCLPMTQQAQMSYLGEELERTNQGIPGMQEKNVTQLFAKILQNVQDLTSGTLNIGEDYTERVEQLQFSPMAISCKQQQAQNIKQYCRQILQMVLPPRSKNMLSEKMYNMIQNVNDETNVKLIEILLFAYEKVTQNLLIALRTKGINFEVEINSFCFGNLPGPLPVYQLRNEFIQNKNRFLCIKSQTGSGKTMLSPIFLSQIYDGNFLTFITQPNQMLVSSISRTIRLISGDSIVINCGYCQAKLQKTKPNICILTPNNLIKVLVQNPQLIATSRFVLDEFHTRTVMMDVLFAILMKNQNLMTKPASLVIMSATPDKVVMDKLNISENQILSINEGRPYKIDIKEVNVDKKSDATTDMPFQLAKQFIDEIVAGTKPQGNILAFTSGKGNCESIQQLTLTNYEDSEVCKTLDFKELEKCCNNSIEQLYQLISDNIKANPNVKLFLLPMVLAGQASEIEKQVASDPFPLKEVKDKCIKVIAATNLVETSLTIQDLVCLIDSGMVKEDVWDTKKGIKTLEEKLVAISSRQQRIGRVGRVCDGFVYLINLKSKDGRNEMSLPQIQRVDIKQSILELKNLKINLEQLQDFLPTRCDPEKMADAYRYLQAIEALTPLNEITEFGRRVQRYSHLSPLQGYLLEKISATGNKFDVMIFILSCLIIQEDLIMENCESQQLKNVFCEESEIVTLIRVFLLILSWNPNDRKKLCNENKFKLRIFNKVFDNAEQTMKLLKQIEESNDYEIDEERSTSQFSELIAEQNNSQQMVKSIDSYIQSQAVVQEKIQLNSSQQNIGSFITLSNVRARPMYLYTGDQQLSDEKEQVIISRFKHHGCSSFSSYDKVLFFDISYNSSCNMYIGQYAHRIAASDNFQRCHSVKIQKNAFQLPFTEYLFRTFLKENTKFDFIRPMLPKGNKGITAGNDRIQDILVYSLAMTEQMFYCVNRQQSKAEQKEMQKVSDQLIEIASHCPDSWITKYPKAPQYNIQVFSNQEKSIDVQFMDSSDKLPYAYSANCETLKYLLSNKAKFTIALTFDLSKNDKEFNLDSLNIKPEYTEDFVFKINGTKFINQIIILSETQLPGLVQLSWVNPQIDSYYAQYVDDDYKLNTITNLIPRNIQVNHLSEEFLLQFQNHDIQVEMNQNSLSQTDKQLLGIESKTIEVIENKQEHDNAQNQLYKQHKQIMDNLQIQFQNAANGKQRQVVIQQQKQENERFNQMKQQLKAQYTVRRSMNVLGRYPVDPNDTRKENKLRNFFDILIQEFVGNNLERPVPIAAISGTNDEKINFNQKMLMKDQLTIICGEGVFLKMNNGLLTCQAKMMGCEKRVQTIEQLSQQFSPQCAHHVYLVQFDIFENTYSVIEKFAEIIQPIIDKFGCLVAEFKLLEPQENKDGKQMRKSRKYIIKIRTTEAAAAFAKELGKIFETGTVIPQQYVPLTCAKIDEVQKYMKAIFLQNHFDKIAIVENQLLGDPKQISQFLTFLHEGSIKLDLPFQEVLYYNTPLTIINKIIKDHQDVKNVDKYHVLVVPKQKIPLVQKVVSEYLEKFAEDNLYLISYGVCEQCAASPSSVPIFQEQTTYKFLCAGCIQSQLEQQLKPDTVQGVSIKISDGYTPVGVLLASLVKANNFTLKCEVFDCVRKLVELREKCQKGFKVCPNCQVFAARYSQLQQDGSLYYCQKRGCSQIWCSSCADWHAKNAAGRNNCQKFAGMKHCPACGAPSEKTGGCNHITCPCGQHWCYICGGAFARDQIYPHMSSAHGGWYQ